MRRRQIYAERSRQEEAERAALASAGIDVTSPPPPVVASGASPRRRGWCEICGQHIGRALPFHTRTCKG